MSSIFFVVLTVVMVARTRPDASDLQDALNAVLAAEETTVLFQGNFSYCLYWNWFWLRFFNFNFGLFKRRIYFCFDNISQPPNPKTNIPLESFKPHCPYRTRWWGWHVRTERRNPQSGLGYRASRSRSGLQIPHARRLRPDCDHDMCQWLCLLGTRHTKVSTF